jgi:hypothetical protein
MAVSDEQHRGLAQLKFALKTRIDTLCDHFDAEAVSFVPDAEVSLFNGLVLIGTALVRIMDEERAEWIDGALASLQAIESDGPVPQLGEVVRECSRLVYETETQRFMEHIKATIEEETARRVEGSAPD